MTAIHKTSILICLAILVVFSSVSVVVKWPVISQWLTTDETTQPNATNGADPFAHSPRLPPYVKDLHPVYTIRAQLYDAEAKISGQIQLEFDNPKQSQIYLYLYDYPQYPMKIQAIHYGKQPIPFDRQKQVVRMNGAFTQEARMQLLIDFETMVPRGGSRFGVKDNIWAVTNWFPLLGALDQQNRWYEPPQRIGFGDPFVYHYADYEVYFTSPKPFQWVSTWGRGQVNSVDAARQQIHYSAKHVINFSLVGSPDYKVETIHVKPNLTVDIASTDQANIARIKAIAEPAFAAFTENYGPLPYPNVAIAETGIGTVYAMEYANMAIFKKDLYWNNLIDHWLPHEIAHMWWYNSVGTLEATFGWLDEGMVESSIYDYDKKRYGESVANNVIAEYAANLEKLKRKYPYGKLSKQLNQYVTEEEFHWTWYSQGALMYHNLRKQIGEEKYLAFLRNVQKKYRGYIIGPEHLDQVLGDVLGGEARYFVPNVQRFNQAPFFSPQIDYYIQTVVNGMGFYPDVPARKLGDTIYLPVRDIMERLGYSVVYSEEKGLIHLKAGASELKLYEGTPNVEVGTKKYQLQQPLKEIQDRAMVPVSFFQEVLGYQVIYDEKTRTVRITVPVSKT